MSPGAPHDAVKYDPLVFLASMRARTNRPAKHIASVVQALRGNSSRTLLLVRNGSDWTFTFDRVLSSGIADPKAENSERREGLPDVMNQVVPFEINDDRKTSGVCVSTHLGRRPYSEHGIMRSDADEQDCSSLGFVSKLRLFARAPHDGH